MISAIRNRNGFVCQELSVAVALMGMMLAIELPVFISIRDGIHNGFNVQELIGTAIIQLGIGLLTGVCFVAFLFALFWVIVGLIIVRDYVTRPLRKS